MVYLCGPWGVLGDVRGEVGGGVEVDIEGLLLPLPVDNLPCLNGRHSPINGIG